MVYFNYNINNTKSNSVLRSSRLANNFTSLSCYAFINTHKTQHTYTYNRMKKKYLWWTRKYRTKRIAGHFSHSNRHRQIACMYGFVSSACDAIVGDWCFRPLLFRSIFLFVYMCATMDVWERECGKVFAFQLFFRISVWRYMLLIYMLVTFHLFIVFSINMLCFLRSDLHCFFNQPIFNLNDKSLTHFCSFLFPLHCDQSHQHHKFRNKFKS